MDPESTQRPKFIENTLLLLAAILAHAPLFYQLPRLAKGVDPTYVHPYLIKHSSFPLVLHMAVVPPFVWILISIVIFVRICRNYGWKLERRL